MAVVLWQNQFYGIGPREDNTSKRFCHDCQCPKLQQDFDA